MERAIIFFVCGAVILPVYTQTMIQLEDGRDIASQTNLAGVYQGKTLFVQNPYDPQSGSYCILKIFINNDPVRLNYNISAIKLDFDGYDHYTPVNIRVHHRDTVCKPVIVNPEAVLFHTIFRFSEMTLTDSILTWITKGERGMGVFEIEKLEDGLWKRKGTMVAKGIFEGAGYSFLPVMEEGHNKFRVRYNFPEGSRRSYLYSFEMDFDHYPDPVKFKLGSLKTKIFLSRVSSYEIYNAGRELTLQGRGKEIDVTNLGRGQYVIYFDGNDPGTFIKD